MHHGLEGGVCGCSSNSKSTQGRARSMAGDLAGKVLVVVAVAVVEEGKVDMAQDWTSECMAGKAVEEDPRASHPLPLATPTSPLMGEEDPPARAAPMVCHQAWPPLASGHHGWEAGWGAKGQRQVEHGGRDLDSEVPR